MVSWRRGRNDGKVKPFIRRSSSVVPFPVSLGGEPVLAMRVRRVVPLSIRGPISISSRNGAGVIPRSTR